MKWEEIGEETFQAKDETLWEIGLHKRKDYPEPPKAAREAQHFVKAEVWREDNRQFAVHTSVDREDKIGNARDAVLKEACRRIDEGDWELSGKYELA